jgi:DNA-binding NarL/FixJ family response regulator
MKTPKLVIVDNNLNFRKRLISLINIEKSARIVGESTHGKKLLRLLTIQQPDVLLIDVDIPELKGIQVIREALNVLPDLKIYAFTLFGDDEYIIGLTKTGVKGFILKSSAIFELDKDIHSLLRDENYSLNNQVIKILNSTMNDRLYNPKGHKRSSRRINKLNIKRHFVPKTRKRLLVLNGIFL